ncbi:outer membrane protein assembly factor BamE [Alphaproteobacteria bacterium]|nr:outer membrane protein assembly factor BamE [Alphaproteobacteria bacterium]
MKPLSLFSSFALVMSLTLFSGCSSQVSTHGHTLEQTKLDLLVPGETSLRDVLIMFGKPSFDGAFGSGKIYYNSQVMETKVAGYSETVSRTLLVLTIDENDILESLEIQSIDDDIKVTKIEAKTPTPGDDYGVLEQIFSNIGKPQ